MLCQCARRIGLDATTATASYSPIAARAVDLADRDPVYA